MANFLTPARGFANILRFRPPWYRDSRIVKASSFFSDAGEGVSAIDGRGNALCIETSRQRRMEAYLADVLPAAVSGTAELAGTRRKA